MSNEPNSPPGYGEPDHRFESPWPECRTCDGTGEIVGPDPDNEDMTCPTCGGSGYVPQDYAGDDW
jgi:DnaJ-class molecular chaperone